MRVIDGIHRDATDGRPDAQPPRNTRFSMYNILVFQVANLADRCVALLAHDPDFTGRQL
jgi:hypothetical protein